MSTTNDPAGNLFYHSTTSAGTSGSITIQPVSPNPTIGSSNFHWTTTDDGPPESYFYALLVMRRFTKRELAKFSGSEAYRQLPTCISRFYNLGVPWNDPRLPGVVSKLVCGKQLTKAQDRWLAAVETEARMISELREGELCVNVTFQPVVPNNTYTLTTSIANPEL